jgi:hypothetical protein
MVAVLTLASLIPTLFTIGYLRYFIVESTKKNLLNQVQTEIALSESALNYFLDERTQSLALWGELARIQNALQMKDASGLDAYFKGLNQNRDYFDDLFLLDSKGDLFFSRISPQEASHHGRHSPDHVKEAQVFSREASLPGRKEGPVYRKVSKDDHGDLDILFS